jgi:hypothetical protein
VRCLHGAVVRRVDAHGRTRATLHLAHAPDTGARRLTTRRRALLRCHCCAVCIRREVS